MEAANPYTLAASLGGKILSGCGRALFWLLVTGLVVSVTAACNPDAGRTDYIPDAALEEGRIQLETTQGLVLYVSGDVTAADSGGERSITVGDLLSMGDTVTTGLGSFCELQFGRIALVRIEEESTVALADIQLGTEQSTITLEASLGSVLCKVEKLSGEDHFSIKTRTAVCGVRGTEFGVTVRSDAGTVLAVREGRVAVLPFSAEAGDPEERASAFAERAALVDPELANEIDT
ncbi:MAG TPA: hypothetical protein ENN69_00605, partial [Spirochaetia bacterium]|nr:hypothetical protein [Spirochaetia bacterium]